MRHRCNSTCDKYLLQWISAFGFVGAILAKAFWSPMMAEHIEEWYIGDVATTAAGSS